MRSRDFFTSALDPDPIWIVEKSLPKRSPIDFPSFADKLESIELGASHSESEPYDFPRQGAQIVFFFPVDQMFHIVAVD